MISKKEEKKIGVLVEQKMLEFFGDPDSGLRVKKEFFSTLQKNMKKNQKITPHAAVLRKYGLR